MSKQNIIAAFTSIVMAFVIVSFSVFPAYGQTVTPALSTVPSGSVNRTQAWCDRIVPRIARLIENATNNLPQRQQYIAKRKQNVQERITKLQQRGADVTQLTSDAQTFSGMLDKWVADFQTYIADLQATQQYSCGTSKGQFAAAVKTANTAHQQVRADLIAFRDYYRSTLIPDFKAARQSIQGKRKPGKTQ